MATQFSKRKTEKVLKIMFLYLDHFVAKKFLILINI